MAATLTGFTDQSEAVTKYRQVNVETTIPDFGLAFSEVAYYSRIAVYEVTLSDVEP